MKLFKILIISIISIFIFQSQIYGINLRCDFKKRLIGINENKENVVSCGWGEGRSVCKIKDSREEDEQLDYNWISEVTIKNKDVVIRYEMNDYDSSRKTNQQKRDWRERENRRVFKVDDVVHHHTITRVNTEHERVYTDRYMIVINETHVDYEGKPGYLGKFYLYTLFFDNLSKNSILTHYYSEHFTNGVSNWTTSYYGECEKI